MELSLRRSIIAIIMSIVLVCAFAPTVVFLQAQFAFADSATKAGPAVKATHEYYYSASIALPDDIYAGNIHKIIFMNKIDTKAKDCSIYFDASEAGDGSVMCWGTNTGNTDEDGNALYDIWYGSDGAYPSFPENSASLFCGMFNLVSIESLERVDTSNVTDMQDMFYNCEKLASINLSNFDTSKVTSMHWMFNRCTSLKNLNLSNFNTSNVADMQAMFGICHNLKSLNLSNFNTSKTAVMDYMFDECKSLTSLDLSSFDTSEATCMDYMFDECKSLTSLNLSNFNTENVTSMNNMFNCCENLCSLDLTNFNTSKVEVFSRMFAGCYSLKSINLSSFDCSNACEAGGMFYGARNLESVYVSSNFKLPDSCESEYIFGQIYKIKGEKGTTFSRDAMDDISYAKIDGGKISPGYFRLAKITSVSLNVASLAYDGKVKTPSVTIKCGSFVLTQGKDYTVSYSGDRKSVGIHKVVIKGVGAYNSSVTKSFVINPKGIALKSVATGNKALTVKWAKSSKANASGYQIQIAKNKKFSKGKKTVNAKGCKAVSKKISKLNSGKKYFVKVRAYKTVGGKTYYSAWSKVLSKKTK